MLWRPFRVRLIHRVMWRRVQRGSAGRGDGLSQHGPTSGCRVRILRTRGIARRTLGIARQVLEVSRPPVDRKSVCANRHVARHASCGSRTHVQRFFDRDDLPASAVRHFAVGHARCVSHWCGSVRSAVGPGQYATAPVLVVRRVEECSRLEEQSTKTARAEGTATSGAVVTST